MSKPNLEDIRTVQIDATPTAKNLGPFVPKDHMRHILALKYNTSGPSTSGITATVYDKWGTSNSVIDKHIFKSLSGGDDNLVHTWPRSPRPDMPIGHVKGSGVASVQTSGGNVSVVMVYVDAPGGRF